jgi:hypothetical protein
MAFRAIYSVTGGKIPIIGYGIAASEAFDRGDVVALNSSGVVAEAAAANADVYGYSLEGVSGGASLGPRSTVCLVVPFVDGVVYATTEVAEATQAPLVTDIGTIRDLVVSSGAWGIAAATASTAATPQFRVVDVDLIRNEWHVVIAPLDIADVFQRVDAEV